MGIEKMLKAFAIGVFVTSGCKQLDYECRNGNGDIYRQYNGGSIIMICDEDDYVATHRYDPKTGATIISAKEK